MIFTCCLELCEHCTPGVTWEYSLYLRIMFNETANMLWLQNRMGQVNTVLGCPGVQKKWLVNNMWYRLFPAEAPLFKRNADDEKHHSPQQTASDRFLCSTFECHCQTPEINIRLMSAYFFSVCYILLFYTQQLRLHKRELPSWLSAVQAIFWP